MKWHRRLGGRADERNGTEMSSRIVKGCDLLNGKLTNQASQSFGGKILLFLLTAPFEVRANSPSAAHICFESVGKADGLCPQIKKTAHKIVRAED